MRFGADGRLGIDGDNATNSVCSPVTTGLAAGQWCAYGQGKIAPELATDQRADDIGSLTYTTDVLVEPLHIVGEPIVTLRASSDREAAFVAVRLCDVRPDGSVERLSYGVFNLCHHASHEFPSPLIPGAAVDVSFKFKGMAQTVPAGHRLRVSVSTSYWPMIWPSPEAPTVTIHHAGSTIAMPTHNAVVRLPDTLFEPPQDAQRGPVTILRPGSETRHVIRELAERTTEFRAMRDDGDYRIDDIGTELSFTRMRSSFVVDAKPLSARARVECRATYRRDTWDVRVETDVELTCDAVAFHITARLTTFDNDAVFAERQFNRSIPRLLI